MTTAKQIQSAQHNVKQAQKTWQNMSKYQKSLRQPEEPFRKKPGMGNAGNYYRVIIRPKSEFVIFRTHDVGRAGHTLRIAGKRSSGSWATHSWLIHKKDAYVENRQLKSKDTRIKKILGRLQKPIKKYKGNIFRTRPRKIIHKKTSRM